MGLRNALIPLITILAFSIPGLFAGGDYHRDYFLPGPAWGA